MKRALGLVALLATVAAVAAVPAGAGPAPGTLTLVDISGDSFPQKSFLLTLPSRQPLTAAAVTVLENGEPVHDLSVAAEGLRIGVVLLLDASMSMAGEPIENAMEAARTFATRLPERVDLAVVTFNNRTNVVLPFTNDPQEVAATLAATPQLAFNTHLYDGIQAAQDLIDSENVDVGSIVVLSDGADVGSALERDQALADADSRDHRIFTVGLASPQFDPATLQALSTESGGSYAQADDPEDLTPIFRRIGERLSSEYVLRYESFAGSGEKVYVTASVAGVSGVATSTYTAPGLPVAAFTSDETWLDRLVQSPILAFLVIALVVLLVGYGVFLLVRLLDRRLERRMSRFVQMSDAEVVRIGVTEDDEAADDDDGEDEATGARRFAWYRTLEDDVELGRIRFTPASIVLFTILVMVAVAAVAVSVTGRPWAALIGLIPPFITRWWVKRSVSRVRRDFGEQLPETLDVVSSALRAGHSLTGALTVAVEGAPDPSHAELGRALADERLGVPLDEALSRVATRMQSEELKQVALVALLQREAGTNVAEVLEQVATNVRHQIDLRRLVNTLTAQGRLSRWIVSLLPVGLFIGLYLLNPEYLAPLWDTTGGIIALIVAGLMIIAGSLVIKRIVEIEA